MEKLESEEFIEETTLEQEAEENDADTAENDENEIEELKAALLEAQIKVALLLAGVAKEKLAEGAKLAEGLCAVGITPEEAAAEVIGGYPHLRALQREIPQLAAQSGGSDDGFAAIRSIFAKR